MSVEFPGTDMDAGARRFSIGVPLQQWAPSRAVHPALCLAAAIKYLSFHPFPERKKRD